MERDLVKRLVTKDGSQRISFYREDYPESPRDMTDEPLHCEDWKRHYSIMKKKERESQSQSARKLLEYLLGNHGSYEKIITLLVEEGKHMTDGMSRCNNALVYDSHYKCWNLMECTKWYGHKEYEWRVAVVVFPCKRDYIDIFTLLDILLDGTIDFLVEQGCLTDKVKIMSYGFGYGGDISFYREFSTDSEGIAWLEKDEFLKYSGNFESYWKENDCYDIEKGLVEEIEAWSNGEVYGFVVEKSIRTQVTKTYLGGEREDESYVETEWVEDDSCWGFYGEFDKAEEWMLLEADIKKEELEEES